MTHRYLVTALCALICTITTAHAGFLDDLAEKAKGKMEGAVEEEVDKQTDKVLDPEAYKQSGETEAQTEKPGSAAKEKTAAPTVQESEPTTTMRQMALAALRLAPGLFDNRPEIDVKEILLILYPEEQEIKTDDFYWHRNKEKLIERALAESKDAPLTFEVAPWINNHSRSEKNSSYNHNNLIFDFGRYDFDRYAFPIYTQNVTIPWVTPNNKRYVRYMISGMDAMPDAIWVDMPIDEAEAFFKSPAGRNAKVWAQYTFTLTDVLGIDNLEEHPDYERYERYLDIEGRRGEGIRESLVPVIVVEIKDNTFNFYAPKEMTQASDVPPRDHFIHVATVQVPAPEEE